MAELPPQDAWITAFVREAVDLTNGELWYGRYLRTVALEQWRERGQLLDPDDAAALWVANRPSAGIKGSG